MIVDKTHYEIQIAFQLQYERPISILLLIFIFWRGQGIKEGLNLDGFSSLHMDYEWSKDLIKQPWTGCPGLLWFKDLKGTYPIKNIKKEHLIYNWHKTLRKTKKLGEHPSVCEARNWRNIFYHVFATSFINILNIYAVL